MRVAVQPHDWQVPHICLEYVAGTRDPGAVDESEIIVLVGSESLDQLGLRVFERFRLGSERPQIGRRPHHHDYEYREHTRDVPELSRPMHG